jgi:hypothetical protein
LCVRVRVLAREGGRATRECSRTSPPQENP